MSDYAIGSNKWPGLAKVIEESSELGQVLGKLVANNGEPDHWDGTNLSERLIEELGDLHAALWFFEETNNLSSVAITTRCAEKLGMFREWHKSEASNKDEP